MLKIILNGANAEKVAKALDVNIILHDVTNGTITTTGNPNDEALQAKLTKMGLTNEINN